MALDEIEVGSCNKTSPETDSNRANGQSFEMRYTAENIEVQAENFVFLLTEKGLKQFESHKKEGHLKGPKKSPPNSDLVETGGAAAGALIGAPFGSIGTGASVGASVSKFIYEFSYGQLHRKKAKAIDKAFEKYSLDESQMLDMLSSIGAEIFRVFERQLTLLEVNDLKKLAHDVVVRVYDAIRDRPDILEKEEFERNAVLARSATDHRTFLDEIFRGHSLDSNESWRTKSLLSKVGIYDNGEYFVSDHTDSVQYQFRLPFKNEVINKDIWHVAKEEQIGSFQPIYFVTEDMINRIQKKAVSRVIAANPKMATIQNAEDTADARDATRQASSFGHEIHAQISEVAAKSEFDKNKVDQLVADTLKMNSFLTNVTPEVHKEKEKSANIEQETHALFEQAVENKDLLESTNSNFREVKDILARLEERQQPKPKIKTSLRADKPDLNYVQREGPYQKLKEFYDARPGDVLDSQRMAVIVGETGVGKSDLARSFANKEFRGKKVLWVEAGNEESMKTSFIGIAKKINIRTTIKIGSIVQEKDTKEIQKEIYACLEPEETLVVFDGVGKFEDIESFMPWAMLPVNPSPHVLITSNEDEDDWRMVQSAACECEIIRLEHFDPDECLQFFKDSLLEGGYDVVEMRDRDEDIIELGRVLGSMPASLANAVDTILNKECSLTDYLSSIRNTMPT